MIPKIIHYCWFGGGEKSELIKECIERFKTLTNAGGGYRIVEWNENNCDITENSYIQKMYEEKRWAFVSDYFRLKALYEYGGIYLDTDVFVYQNFDSLLDCDLFLGFIYDCALGTAVIGCKPKNLIIKELLGQYKTMDEGRALVNNGLVTDYFLEQVPNFKLNGKEQTFNQNGEKICIYPKTAFETGKVIGKSYTLHFADGSWHIGGRKRSYKVKILCAKLPINVMALRQQIKAKKYMKKSGKYQSIYNKMK